VRAGCMKHKLLIALVASVVSWAILFVAGVYLPLWLIGWRPW